MEFVLIVAILTLVVVVVSAPLRREAAMRARTDTGDGRPGDAEAARVSKARTDAERDAAFDLADLEAARDAKYREIRDAELDHRTGKLSDADYGALDESLRAEAIEILRALDRAAERSGATIGER